MPEDKNLQNAQDANAGNQDLASGSDDQNQSDSNNQPGGPSDEWKMRRLEDENRKYKEHIDRLEAERIKNEKESMSPEERFTAEREDFYTKRTSTEIMDALAEEFKVVPDRIKEAIKEDPFNPAWCPRKELEYELIGVSPDDMDRKYAAAKKVAEKNIREYINSFTPAESQKKQEENEQLGNNPPIETGPQGPIKKDLYMYSEDELREMRNASISN